MSTSQMYKSLCGYIASYVASTLDSMEQVEPQVDLPKFSLEKVFEEEGIGDIPLKLIGALNDLRTAPDQETLYNVQLRFATETIVSSWSETLRWAYKEQGRVELNASLLPQNLGRAEKLWTNSISRIGFSEAQVGDILRQLGDDQKSSSIELPWGGYVSQIDGTYFLDKSD